MKFTSNSSSSSTSAKFNDSGCIRGALRRFLCFHNTLPSDHFQEAENVCYTNSEVDTAESSATPGLVARLMGLDSMPLVDFAKLDSVRRTRSMDSLRDIELVQGKHRHVKSTLSFRDAPTFLELENEDFFILSFENKDLGLKPRKSDLGFSEMRPKRSEDKNKRRQNVQERDKQNVQVSDKRLQAKNNSKDSRTVLRPINNCRVDSKSPEVVKQIRKPINNKQTPERGKLRTTKKKKREQNCSSIVEKECDSENTSPVSVLDFSESPTECEASSSVHNARLTTSNSRRTLFEELKHYNSSALITSRIVHTQEVKNIGVGIWNISHKHSQNYAEMWEQVCKFAETDIKQTKWMYKERCETEEFDEITASFEFEILDQLLQEMVYQIFA